MKTNCLQNSANPYHLARPSSYPVNGSLNILGVGYDGTACFRKGASGGPDAIRQVSWDLESYSPYFDIDLEEIPPYFDIGNLLITEADSRDQECTAIHSEVASITEGIDPAVDNTAFLVLGGEHSVSYPLILKYLKSYSDLLLVHLDAHADLRNGYEGNHFSHASIIRRCLDNFGSGHQLVQFGIRSGTREEYDWMRSEKTLYNDLSSFTEWLKKLSDSRPIYLSLDLDFFDPAFLPGTGTPEAGGIDFTGFMEILAIVRNKNLVGADVVELAPDLDQTGNSSIFAAKVVRELIIALDGRKLNGN